MGLFLKCWNVDLCLSVRHRMKTGLDQRSERLIATTNHTLSQIFFNKQYG